MKRTVFHISKQFINESTKQSQVLFPFLNSKIVQSYSKSIVKYKGINIVCNIKNMDQVLPFSSPSKQFIFFGRSNVGKSTLLNKLLQAPIATVSKRPGKTKQLTFFEVGSNNPADKKIIEQKLYLVDAPGYGYATGVPKSQINQWGKLITSYLKKTKHNSINQKFLCLIDLTHDLKQTDAIIFELLKSLGKNFQLIFTKCDRFNFEQDSQQFKKGLEIAKIVQNKYQAMSFYTHFTSSRTLLGIDNLRNQIMFDIVSNKI